MAESSCPCPRCFRCCCDRVAGLAAADCVNREAAGVCECTAGPGGPPGDEFVESRPIDYRKAGAMFGPRPVFPSPQATGFTADRVDEARREYHATFLMPWPAHEAFRRPE